MNCIVLKPGQSIQIGEMVVRAEGGASYLLAPLRMVSSSTATQRKPERARSDYMSMLTTAHPYHFDIFGGSLV